LHYILLISNCNPNGYNYFVNYWYFVVKQVRSYHKIIFTNWSVKATVVVVVILVRQQQQQQQQRGRMALFRERLDILTELS